jgi:hypothetical protein
MGGAPDPTDGYDECEDGGSEGQPHPLGDGQKKGEPEHHTDRQPDGKSHEKLHAGMIRVPERVASVLEPTFDPG